MRHNDSGSSGIYTGKGLLLMREHCIVPSCGGSGYGCQGCVRHAPYEGFIWTPRQEREGLLFETLMDAAELLVLGSKIDKNKACLA